MFIKNQFHKPMIRPKGREDTRNEDIIINSILQAISRNLELIPDANGLDITTRPIIGGSNRNLIVLALEEKGVGHGSKLICFYYRMFTH